MAVLEIGAVLSRTFVSTLFATLLRNHKTYRDTVVPMSSSESLVGIKYHQLLSK